MLRDTPGVLTNVHQLKVGDEFLYSGDGYSVLYKVYEHTWDPYGFSGVRATFTKGYRLTGRQGFDGRLSVRLICRDGLAVAV